MYGSIKDAPKIKTAVHAIVKTLSCTIKTMRDVGEQANVCYSGFVLNCYIFLLFLKTLIFGFVPEYAVLKIIYHDLLFSCNCLKIIQTNSNVIINLSNLCRQRRS